MSKTGRNTSSVPAKTVEFTDIVDSAGPPPGPAGMFGAEKGPPDLFPGAPLPGPAGPFGAEKGSPDRFPNPSGGCVIRRNKSAELWIP